MNSLVAATFIVAVTLMRCSTAALAGGHSAGVSSFPVSKHGSVGYHGPLAKPVIQKDGHLADNIEVAAARGEHLIAVAKAHSTTDYGSDDDGGSSGHGNLYDPGYEGALHGIYSYGPTTGDIYKGEYGYAGLQSFSTDHSNGHEEAGSSFGGQGGSYGHEATGSGFGPENDRSSYSGQGGSHGHDDAGSSYSGQGGSYGHEDAGSSYSGQGGSYGLEDAGSSYGGQGGSYGHEDAGSSYGGLGGSYGHDDAVSSYGGLGGSYGHEEAGSSFGGQGGSYGHEEAGSSYGGQGGSYGSQAGGYAYHGPLAASVVLKSGYLADTHDVAAAKGAHYVALSLASQHEAAHH